MTRGSLQRALVRSTLLVALVLATLGSVFAAVSAFRSARELQDDILDSVAVLVRGGRLAPPAEAAPGGPLDDHDVEDEAILVERLDGRRDARARFAATLADGFHTVTVRGDAFRVRVATTRAGGRVAIAQRTTLRNERALTSAGYVLLPLAALVVALLVAIPLTVRRALTPLRDAARAIDTATSTVAPLPDTDRVPSELRPFVRAIAALRTRDRQVLERQRRFVADAAHELRTPIAALAVQFDNLANASDAAERADRQGKLGRGLERLQRLVTQLLDLARLQGDDGQTLSPVSLSAVVRETVADLTPLVADRSLDIGLEQDDGVRLPEVPGTLARLVRNALENAIAHSPNGARIDIRILREGPLAVLLVDDEGPGIPADELQHVLTPFYRSASNSTQGSGLGLAICVGIAERLGGKLTLGNRATGGLRFRYEQPLRKD